MIYEHGGDIYTREIRHDFSVNVNPLGLPKSVKQILEKSIERFSVYPDPYCKELIQAIAIHERVPENTILCGNGAADLIYCIAEALRPKKALLLTPTFSEYEKALQKVGCEIEYHPLLREDGFLLKSDILEKLTENQEIFFLCNPNNPTGMAVPPDLLKKIIERCKQYGISFVVDECFIDFVEDKRSSAQKYLEKGIILLKAFTKTYAMAGLRLGYLICKEKPLLEKIQRLRPPWNVSVPAQLAGMAALQEKEYVKMTVDVITKERERLSNSLEKIGFVVYPSDANFILFKADFPLQNLLLKKQIAIRDCSNYRGLESGFFRIAVRLPKENQILLNAIEKEYTTWRSQL